MIIEKLRDEVVGALSHDTARSQRGFGKSRAFRVRMMSALAWMAAVRT
jgi:hypothetical protein